jgi:hypothetical protein
MTGPEIQPVVATPPQLMPVLEDDTFIEETASAESTPVIGQTEQPVAPTAPAVTAEELQKRLDAAEREKAAIQSAKDQEIVKYQQQLYAVQQERAKWAAFQAQQEAAQREAQAAAARAKLEQDKREFDEWSARATPEQKAAFAAAQQIIQQEDQRKAWAEQEEGRTLAMNAMYQGVPGQVIQQVVSKVGYKPLAIAVAIREFALSQAQQDTSGRLDFGQVMTWIKGRKRAPVAPAPAAPKPMTQVTPGTAGSPGLGLHDQFKAASKKGDWALAKKLHEQYLQSSGVNHTEDE